MAFDGLREFLDVLREENELVTIDFEIDPHLKIGAVGELSRLGPAVHFTKVKGSDKSVPLMCWER